MRRLSRILRTVHEAVAEVGVGQGAVMDWARILAYVTGTVDQELLARKEYLAAENRIIKAQLKGRLKLWDAERGALGEIGHRVGRKALAEVASVARPDTILAWYRKLIARKFDGSKARNGPGRPRIKREVEQLIIRMAKENRDWGYDRIAGALADPGKQCTIKPRDQTSSPRIVGVTNAVRTKTTRLPGSLSEQAPPLQNRPPRKHQTQPPAGA